MHGKLDERFAIIQHPCWPGDNVRFVTGAQGKLAAPMICFNPARPAGFPTGNHDASLRA